MNPANYVKHDNYETPFSAWKSIIDLIPKDKIYYDSFYCKGSSGNHLRNLGLNVIHENVDFFSNTFDYDIIITNPPFSIKKQVLKKLFQDSKPFIMIMPVAVLCSKMYRPFIDQTTIIIPSSRIQFVKNGDTTQGKCPFDSVYYCWKMNLNSKIICL